MADQTRTITDRGPRRRLRIDIPAGDSTTDAADESQRLVLDGYGTIQLHVPSAILSQIDLKARLTSDSDEPFDSVLPAGGPAAAQSVIDGYFYDVILVATGIETATTVWITAVAEV